MSQILITEQQLERLSRSILREQGDLTTMQPTEIVEAMSQDVNTFLESLSYKTEEGIPAMVAGTDINAITLQIGNGKPKKFKWEPDKRRAQGGRGILTLLVTNDFSSTIIIPDLYEKFIVAYPKYETFFSRDNEITNFVKNQIENLEVNIGFKPMIGGASIRIFPLRKEEMKNFKKKYWGSKKETISLNEPFSFGKLIKVNDSNQLLVKGMPGALTKGYVEKVLDKITLNLPSQGGETPRTDIGPITMDFNTSENFDFNRATLTPEAINQIQTQILTPISQLGTRLEGYINRLQQNPIVLTAFASRDDDPAATDYNSDPNTRSRLYQPCVTQTTRGGYNQCLSAARAQAVVDHLRETAPEIFGNVNFRPIGGGENIASGNQWVSGKTDHDFTTTRADRNFIIDLPAWTTR